MLNFIFGNNGIANCVDACDANDSGVLTIGDPIYILTFQFSGGTAPSAPYPTCGLDPSTDALDCVGFSGCPTCAE